jgi:leucyl-tRNA synthetase
VELGESASVHLSAWPSFDPALGVEETVTLVVQVNGKVRDKVEVPADVSEADALVAARASAGARRSLEGREVVKEIVRAPKLVNFVVKG